VGVRKATISVENMATQIIVTFGTNISVSLCERSNLFVCNFVSCFVKKRVAVIFRFHYPRYAGKIWKMQRTPFILDLCLIESLAGKSRGYRDVIVNFRKVLFPKCFPSTLRRKPAFSNSSSLKNVSVTD